MSQRFSVPPAAAPMVVLVAAGLLIAIVPAATQYERVGTAVPRSSVDAYFVPTTTIRFPNATDSNSPSFWIDDRFHLFNSFNGRPRLSSGPSLEKAVDMPDVVPGRNTVYLEDLHVGAWLEAVIPDESSGLLYGWYHAEFVLQCPKGQRFYPVIGAVVSETNGTTWHDLGIVLSPRGGEPGCDTNHPVTAGGVGDFSVILDNNTDPADHYAYFLFSNYSGSLEEQGISFARMLWIDRDRPIDEETGQSRVLKWHTGYWTERGLGGWSTPLPDSRRVSWQSASNSGYWGPSVHWNVDLRTFVILMSRSKGGNYVTEGIYVTSNDDPSNPGAWATPRKIAESGQGWYPQVVGAASIRGTDRLAGRTARYFNAGRSTSLIVFQKSQPATGGPR